MPGIVNTNVVVANDVVSTDLVSIAPNAGYSVFLSTENLAGTVEITVFGSNKVGADPADTTEWAAINTATLSALSAYLLNVDRANYDFIFVQIDGLTGTGSFNNGYLRIVTK